MLSTVGGPGSDVEKRTNHFVEPCCPSVSHFFPTFFLIYIQNPSPFWSTCQVAHSVSRKTREAILERAKVLDVKVTNAAARMRTEENE